MLIHVLLPGIASNSYGKTVSFVCGGAYKHMYTCMYHDVAYNVKPVSYAFVAGWTLYSTTSYNW